MNRSDSSAKEWTTSTELIVELDSVRFHHNIESFVNDRRRSNRLTAAGWTVLSFTWRDFVDDPRSLVALVKSQLL